MPSQLAKPRAPSGTVAIHNTVSAVVTSWLSWMPIPIAANVHSGVASSHSTMFLAYHSLRSVAGSARAAVLRAGSPPSRLVAGTSAYIQMASTIAKASGPWKENNASTALGGNRVQHKVINRPLPTTTTGVSYGGRRARRNSTRIARGRVAGSDTSTRVVPTTL